MATETKIALLIGLAFIIAFGFLLARQDEAAREQQTDQQVAPPPEVLAADRGDVAPEQRAWRPADGEDRLVHSLHVEPSYILPSDPALAAAGDPQPDGDPQAVNIVGITGQAPPAMAVAPNVADRPSAPMRWYTVEPGDNLIRIARKFYGAENGDKWRLILEANPDRIPSPEGLRPRVRIGIPPLPGQTPPAAVPMGPTLPAAPAPTAVGVRTYVVKIGDTLSGIASRELGSSREYHKILEWNRDVIRDANAIRPGMTLKLGSGTVPSPPPIPLVVGASPSAAAVLPVAASVDRQRIGPQRIERMQAILTRTAMRAAALSPERQAALQERGALSLSNLRTELRRLLDELGTPPEETREIFSFFEELDFPFAQLEAVGRRNLATEQREREGGRVLIAWLPSGMQRLGVDESTRRAVLQFAALSQTPGEAPGEALQQAAQQLMVAVLQQSAQRSGEGYVSIPQVELTPVVPQPAVAGAARRGGLYVVQPGDTLSEIASKQLGTSTRWRDLLRWNGDVLTEPRYLRPGMRLRLSAPRESRSFPRIPIDRTAPVRAATAGEPQGGGIVG